MVEKVTSATPAVHIVVEKSLRGESGVQPMCLSDFLQTALRTTPSLKFATVTFPRDTDEVTAAVSEAAEEVGVNESWWVRMQEDGTFALSATKPTGKQVTVPNSHAVSSASHTSLEHHQPCTVRPIRSLAHIPHP